MVALRKESVDRNLLRDCRDSVFERSLSARRAWIEIIHGGNDRGDITVALRKESVDRNRLSINSWPSVGSLSARRAWIEMLKIGLMLVPSLGRSPQGERG